MAGMQTAVVTGASRGIGKAIALSLADAGCNVVVNYASSEGPAMEVVKECEAKGVKAVAVKANVAIEDEVDTLFKAATEMGGCDILVNNGQSQCGVEKFGLTRCFIFQIHGLSW